MRRLDRGELNEGGPSHHVGGWVIGRRPLLRVPPHRSCGVVGVDDHRRVRTVGHWTAVGVVEQLTGSAVATVPAVDHECRRAGPQVGDVSVQRVELVGRTQAGELVETVPEPSRSALKAADFAAPGIDFAFDEIREPRRGHRWVPLKGRQSRQRAVKTVVAPPQHLGTAVVDQVAVGVGPRVGMHLIATVRGTQRILHCGLVTRILDGGQSSFAVHPRVRWITTRPRRFR